MAPRAARGRSRGHTRHTLRIQAPRPANPRETQCEPTSRRYSRGMTLLERHVCGFAREVLETFPAAVIQGARQVGKSTLALQLASGANARAFTLDDPQTLAAAIEDPSGFVDQQTDGVIIIDEVQRYPELMLAIKASIDRDRRPGRFILTGSSDLLKTRRSTDSLAGRAA